MNGDGTFNAQILVDKLAKLNSSQQSIETLSHWCIFHRKNAKQVVETWERQFHSSSRDRRVSFLYLANDILQNSRRKGMEFVGEFWRVLPNALNDVIDNGDEFGRKAALRLVDIWEERKVFSPRGQTLKEEFLGRNRNGKNINYKLKQSGDMLEKLIASYRHASEVYDEETLFGKCRTAINTVEKVEKEIGSDFNLGNISESGVVGELQVQHGLLKECVEQLKVAESSRVALASHLREALNEQEFKIEQLRNQLQVAQVRYEQVGRLLIGQVPPPPLPGQNLDDIPPPPPPDSAYSEAPPPPDFPPESPATTIGDGVQPTPVRYSQQHAQGPLSDTSSHHTAGEEHQTAAADVSGKLTSSSSSSHMISYVLSSLASEGVIGQSASEDFPSDANKRPRLSNGGLGSVPCYLPQPQQPPPPPFPHPDSMHLPLPPPLPPSLPPVPPPLPPSAGGPPPFGQAAGSMTLPPFSYGSPPVPPPMPGFPMVGVPPYPGPPSPYQFQGPDGGFFGQPPYPGPPQMSRQ